LRSKIWRRSFLKSGNAAETGPLRRQETRDIDLADAILDLLDNCIDGILRQAAAPANVKAPYKGFRAQIIATSEKFELTDNCGGIPREIALNSAFRLGRTAAADEKLATVGMYGIGMKRALFKMGRHSTVLSQPDGAAYVVDIPPAWLDNDVWNLELQETEETLNQNGTRILVRELNDSRVVVHNDKSMRTGWGRGTVPNYHNQFISIAGVVYFRSDDPWKLPLNTTKRGLDTDSIIFMQTLDYMMEGTKKFTEFTNKWKGREAETKTAFSATEVVKPSEAFESIATATDWIKVRKTGGEKRSPNLPLPPSNQRTVRVSFKRDKAEAVFLAGRLLDDEQAKPSDVGIRCWEDVLEAERAK
jgi:hypothetical protein